MTMLTRTVVENAGILRGIADGLVAACATKAEFAAKVERDPSNMNRAIKVMQTEGLLTEDGDGALIPDLTPLGRSMVAALDRADGGVVQTSAPERWPHNRIRLDPANRKSAERDIPQLAQSIKGAKGVLQPVLLGPVEDDGMRLCKAGHRRWLAVEQLISEGHPLFPAHYGMKWTDREDALEDDEADQAFVAIIENGQRVDMSPVEQARAFARLIEKAGISAREAAQRTGIHERRVQEGQRVLKAARPEDIAAHEADPKKFTWEELRDSVKDLDLDAGQALVMLELADKVDRNPVAVAAGESGEFLHFARVAAQPQPGSAGWALDGRKLIDVYEALGGVFMRPALERAPVERWLDVNGFNGDRPEVLRQAREAFAGPAAAALLANDEGRYLTDWLNVRPLDAPSAAEIGESVKKRNGEVMPAPSAFRRADELDTVAKIVLLELTHAIAHGRGKLVIRPESADGPAEYWRAVPAKDAVGAIPESLRAAGPDQLALVDLFRTAALGAPRLCACLTRSGQAVAAALADGLQSVDLSAEDGDAILNKALTALGATPGQSAYLTPWLNEDWDLGSQSDLVADLAAKDASASEGNSDGKGDDKPALNNRTRLALVELYAKIVDQPVAMEGDDEAAEVGAYWLDATAPALTAAGYVRFVGRPGQRFVGVVTDAGREYLDGEGLLGMGDMIGEGTLDRLRGEAGKAAWPGPGYVTPWLHVETAGAPFEGHHLGDHAQPTPTASEPLSIEREKDDWDASTIQQVDRAIALGAIDGFTAGALACAFAALGYAGPYHTDPDQGGVVLTPRPYEALAVVDVNGQRRHEIADAGARLLAHVLNVTMAKASAEPDACSAAPEDEGVTEALIRSGKLARDLMLHNFEALAGDPLATDTYRQLSEALNRAELAARDAAAKAEAVARPEPAEAA